MRAARRFIIKSTTINIDGIDYVRADSIKPEPLSDFYIVRADSGLFFARVKSRTDREAILTNCRQLHYWKTIGLNYLDIAINGVLDGSKITHEVPEITVLDVRSLTACTDKAATSIAAVKPWKAS